jgi:hypothetical protein
MAHGHGPPSDDQESILSENRNRGVALVGLVVDPQDARRASLRRTVGVSEALGAAGACGRTSGSPGGHGRQRRGKRPPGTGVTRG